MCGFLGKISNSPISLERLNKANFHNVCRGPDALKCETGKYLKRFRSQQRRLL